MSLTNHFIRFGLFLLIAAAVIARFTSIWPNMPEDGLDPSWMIGINQAVFQGLRFGSEMIFTYGPYAGILSKSYHPGTDFICNAGGIFLGTLYLWALLQVIKDFSILHLTILLALLSGLMLNLDSLVASYSLLAGLLCIRIYKSPHDKQPKGNRVFFLTILFFPFGLLPLIKGSFLAISIGVTLLSSTLFIADKDYRSALATITSPFFSLLVFWKLAGQPTLGLPEYFTSISQIISGYTDAMSIDGSTQDVAVYLLFSASLLTATLISNQGKAAAKNLYITAIIALFLFISFKAGFVRHDLYHILTPAFSILISSVLSINLIIVKYRNHLAILSVTAWAILDSHSAQSSTSRFIDNTKGFYYSTLTGALNLESRGAILEKKYTSSLNSIKSKAKLPLLEGSSDIYSSAQSALIASGNDWNPRPVLQSYSAYSKSLAQKNRDHLLKINSPANIFFKVDPIDGNLPSSEDGLSWPVLLHSYSLNSFHDEYALLKRKSTLNTEPNFSPPVFEKHQLGELVALTPNAGIIFITISVSKTILGKFLSILYKPRHLTININLANGGKRSYRLLPGMAESGFVISPLIENSTEFSELYNRTKVLENKAVLSYSITACQYNWEWQSNYNTVLTDFKP